MKICVQFQDFKNLHPHMKFENIKFLKFQFPKKSFGSNTDTEIGPWFRFPILKPGFGCTLIGNGFY